MSLSYLPLTDIRSRREVDILSDREIITTCPDCGGPIYADENAMTGFCEECSKNH